MPAVSETVSEAGEPGDHGELGGPGSDLEVLGQTDVDQ